MNLNLNLCPWISRGCAHTRLPAKFTGGEDSSLFLGVKTDRQMLAFRGDTGEGTLKVGFNGSVQTKITSPRRHKWNILTFFSFLNQSWLFGTREEDRSYLSEGLYGCCFSYENPVQVDILISIGGQGLGGKQLPCDRSQWRSRGTHPSSLPSCGCTAGIHPSFHSLSTSLPTH